MHRTHLPLHKWFYAMHLFSTSRHGVPAKELERQLGIPYKTAWRMAHEIRKYMAKVDGEHPLDGEVEADETYIGGKTTGGKRGRGAPNKTVVFGMLERDGDVMAKVVPNVRMKTLQPIIEENVVAGSTVHTDELKSYNGLSKAGFEHETVNHSAGEYVDGECHVNGIEGFWARLKLSIRGTPRSRVGEAPSEVCEGVLSAATIGESGPLRSLGIWWRASNHHRIEQSPKALPRNLGRITILWNKCHVPVQLQFREAAFFHVTFYFCFLVAGGVKKLLDESSIS